MARLNSSVGDPVTIRKCHQNRCDWADDSAPLFLDRNWRGENVWKIRLLCQRGCGSMKEMQFRPQLPLEEYVSRRRIERPSNWYEVGEYFTAALSQRVALGEVQLYDVEGRPISLVEPHV
jgi:hypothetical protein